MLAPTLLDISSGFEQDMQAVRANRKLSAEGKRNEARDLTRKALHARQDRLKPLNEHRAKTEAMKANVKLPDYDRADDYAARLRAEMRDKSYDMTALERMGLMSGPNRVVYFDAISEQPLFMSGLREKGELDAYAALKEERLAELHGPLQAAIAERESAESEIVMVDNMMRNDLASDSVDAGLTRAEFEAEAKAIESKAAAEAPKAAPEGRPTAPSPEFEEIWKRFDQMVDASVA
jgi:hypothetical protein